MAVLDHPLYKRQVIVAGVPILVQPIVRDWTGWPADVRKVLHKWNNKRRLRFAYCGAMWGGYGSGFEALTCKCVECGSFFNSSGTTACRLDGRWVCDDCIVTLARAEL